MKKYNLMKTTKLQKMIYAIFVTLMCSSLVGGITAFAAKTSKTTTTNWRVTKAASVQTGYKNIGRFILWEGLLGLGNIADSFNKAIDKLLKINLYSLAGSQFNISSSVYPIAGAVLAFSITLVGFIIILKAHNGNHLERVSTMIGSLILLAALPSLISAASDIKTAGTRWAKDSFEIDGGYEYNDDGTVTPQSLGNTLIISNVYDMGKSIDKNNLTRVSQKKVKAQTVNINSSLDKEKYNSKPYPFKEVYISDDIKSAQNKYSELSLDDKINIIDRCYAASNYPGAAYSKSVNVGSLKKIWESHEDDYIEPEYYLKGGSSLDYGRYVAKSGGRTSAYSKSPSVYCKIEKDGDSWKPIRQIFKTNATNLLVVYEDPSRVSGDPYNGMEREEGESDRAYQIRRRDVFKREIQWGRNWYWGTEHNWVECEQYEMRYDIDNYQMELCWQLAQELKNTRTLSHLPSTAKDFIGGSFLNDIENAGSLENAITILESKKIKYKDVEFSVMEWFNLENNINIVEKMDEDDMFESVDWVLLNSFNANDVGNVDLGYLISEVISHGGLEYADEHLYAYHVDWFNAYLILIVTDICLLFAGFKIASLMFDVLFAEIVAPIAMASDVTGSGRAKQVVSNLLACNISFVAVIYIVRLFLSVLLAMNENPNSTTYTIVVKIFITLAGAKFVIDGPDLIVKLTGMDAGVKSGLSTLMGVRTAAQMAGGAAKVANKGAGAVGGLAGGVASGAKNGKGVAGKAASAALGGVSGMSAGARNGGLFGGAGAGSAAGSAVGNASGLGKVSAAMGNSSAGQAFKSGAANQARTNDSYAGSSGSQSASGGSANGSSSNSPISMAGKDGSDGKDGHDGMSGSDGKDADNNQNDKKNETANAPQTTHGGGSVGGGSVGGGSVGGGSVGGGSVGGGSVGGGSVGGGSVGGGSVGGGSVGGGSVGGGSVSGGSIGGGGSVSVGSSSASSGGTYTPASSSGVSSASGSYSSYNNDLSSSNSSPTISVPTSDWEILKDNYDNRIGDTTNWRGGKDPNPLRPDRRK